MKRESKNGVVVSGPKLRVIVLKMEYINTSTRQREVHSEVGSSVVPSTFRSEESR